MVQCPNPDTRVGVDWGGQVAAGTWWVCILHRSLWLWKERRGGPGRDTWGAVWVRVVITETEKDIGAVPGWLRVRERSEG